MHSVTVWVAVAVFLALVVALRRTPGLFDRFGAQVSTWMFLAVVQGGIGYVQYFTGLPWVLVAVHLLGSVLVFFVLAGLYEGWSLPFSVILVVPMCVLCAVTGVAVRGMDNNLVTQIGFVVLIGLAGSLNANLFGYMADSYFFTPIATNPVVTGPLQREILEVC